MLAFLLQAPEDSFKLSETVSNALKRLNIHRNIDLLLYPPYRYLTKAAYPSLANLTHGSVITAKVTIREVEIPSRRSLPIKIYADNETGSITLVFFHKIPPFIFQRLRIGTTHIIEGKVEKNDFFYQIKHPDFIFEARRVTEIEPIYHLTYGLMNKQLHGLIMQLIDKLQNWQLDIGISSSISFMEAIRELHAPKKLFPLENSYSLGLDHGAQELSTIDNTPSSLSIAPEYIKHLAFCELLANQLSLCIIREKLGKTAGRSFPLNPILKQQILDNLGFSTTLGQEQVLAEIEADQQQPLRMTRILQGDVGSGKTLVALLAMANVVSSGVQTALMAPTDLLASQHYEFFSKALTNTNIMVALLTGKTKPANRKIIAEGLTNGNIQILIGTHALFQEQVAFADLGFIVIDEQHRFGVGQRMQLIDKATTPDLLVMTATPIPRSLALTLFGDMASSKLTSKPAGRKDIITTTMSNSKMLTVIDSLERKLTVGEKIYWICPLISKKDNEEENAMVEAMDAETRHIFLTERFPGIVGLMHGRMKNTEKDLAMQSFKSGETKILVATTVIEVGIDVPDATLIIIENAEKFGLAQLHQLRGRVGRSNLQSHAILLFEPKRLSAVAKERLSIMRDSNDGFYLAEQDLLLRGSGDILGTRQSGEEQFIFANLGQDLAILQRAQDVASKMVGAGNIPEGCRILLQLFGKNIKAEQLCLE